LRPPMESLSDIRKISPTALAWHVCSLDHPMRKD
jgi:hypothetical protein